MQQHMSPHDQYRQPFVARIDGGDAVNGYDWTEVVWDRTEYVVPDSPRTGVASLFGLNGAAAAVNQLVTARFRAVSPDGDPTFLFGDGGSAPQVARVTGGVAAGLYPAVLTSYDQDAATWADADSVQLLPLNGEALETGQRYMAIPAGGAPTAPPTWLAVATCCGETPIDPDYCGCCEPASGWPSPTTFCFVLWDLWLPGAVEAISVAISGVAEHILPCDYFISGSVALTNDGTGYDPPIWTYGNVGGRVGCINGEWKPNFTVRFYREANNTDMGYVDFTVRDGAYYTFFGKTILSDDCDPFCLSIEWPEVSVRYTGSPSYDTIANPAARLTIGSCSAPCDEEPGYSGGSGVVSSACGECDATAESYTTTIAGVAAGGCDDCSGVNASYTLARSSGCNYSDDITAFTGDCAVYAAPKLRMAHISGATAGGFAEGVGWYVWVDFTGTSPDIPSGAYWFCSDANFNCLGVSAFAYGSANSNCTNYPSSLTVTAVP